MSTRLLWCWLAAATCGRASSRSSARVPIEGGLDVITEIIAAVREAETRAGSLLPVEDELSSPPRRPHVPHSFVAPLRQPGSLRQDELTVGLYAYNLDRKTLRMELNNELKPLARKLDLNSSDVRLMKANSSFAITGGNDSVCRSVGLPGQQFHDMFSWAADPQLSVFEGSTSVGDRPCDRWRLRSANTSTELTLCTDGDAPVQLAITSARTFDVSSNLTFGSLLALGPTVDQRLFDVPAGCSELAPPCSAARGLDPRSIDVYVFHPGMSAADYDIADQNVADLDGDAMFICFDMLLPQQQKAYVDHNYTRISRYSLLVSPAFGQYGACNGYPDTSPPGPICFGGDTRLVGRAAPGCAGPGELRCAAESPIGFFYSLPRSGQCPPGRFPSTGSWREGCTWSTQKRLKTVGRDCLLKTQRLPDKCAADVKAGTGFRLSARALALAFSSENVSAGGCPDVGGPPQEEATVIV